MNRPDLAALGAYWQKVLRLQDWRVRWEYVRDLCNAAGQPVHGLCSYLADNKTATIRVRDPETPIPGDPKDPEHTVIHELSHLHYAAFCASTPAEITAEEQGVWAFSDALYAVKGTPQEGVIARAMVARAEERRALVARMGGQRSMDMVDPMVIAALEAALEAEDPKAAVQALLEKVKGMGGGDEPAAQEAEKPDMAQETEEPNKPPMAALAEPAAVPRAQRASMPARPAAPEMAQQLRAMMNEALAPIVRDMDTFKRDQLLRERGQVLSESQLRWARTQSYETVKGLLDATHGDGTRERGQRANAPARGGATGSSSTGNDPAAILVDRAMRVQREAVQAVTIDQRTNRLSISNLTPVVVAPQGGEG